MKQYPWNPTVYYNDFADFVAGIASHGDKPAISVYDRRGTEAVYTYSQLCSDIAALRRALDARGLAGRHTAIVGENSYSWIVAFLAVTSAGGVAVCIDIEQPDNAIGRMLRQSQTEVIFASDSVLGICRELMRDTIAPGHIFSLSEGADSLFSLITEGQLLSEERFSRPGKDHPAAIVFTSGTTAQAKAVLLTNENLLSNAGAAVAALDLGETSFTGLPFFHTYGLCCGMICSLLRGTHLTVSGDLRTMLRDLSLSGAGTMFAVPLILEVVWKNARTTMEKSGKWHKTEKLLRCCSHFGWPLKYLTRKTRKILHDKCFGSLNTVICGGAHMNEEISKYMELLGISVLQGYGITECSPLIAVNRNYYRRINTVGTLLPGWELRLERNEILVKGPSLMAGYFNDPEATAEAVTDGWFHTGDLGEISADGQLSIVGRIKNLIVLKNGKKISPERIEALIMQIPQVKEAVVYGAVTGSAADDVRPAVSIFPDPELCRGMNQFDILNLLQERVNAINATLPTYQQIKLISIREKEFDKTASQKTIRNVNEAHT